MPLWYVELEWTAENAVLVDAPTREEAEEIAGSEEHRRGDYCTEEDFFARASSKPLDPDDEEKLRELGVWGSGMIGADGERIDHDKWDRARRLREEEERARRETPGTDENRAALEAEGQARLPEGGKA